MLFYYEFENDEKNKLTNTISRNSTKNYTNSSTALYHSILQY